MKMGKDKDRSNKAMESDNPTISYVFIIDPY
jgi:hypothetical protein